MTDKILVFDIEATSLKADFGYMLCFGHKWYGQKSVLCPMIDMRHRKTSRFREAEKELVIKAKGILESADIWVTYNGKRYDVPFIQCKMLEYDLGVLPPTPHVDLYYTVKHPLQTLSRKRLDTVSYYLQTGAEKSPVEGRIWVSAMMGDRSAMRYIVRHCRADVEVLEEVYTRLRPLVRQHPRVSGYGPCRACGSTHLQRRGQTPTTMRGPRVRVFCPSCGTWESRPLRDMVA